MPLAYDAFWEAILSKAMLAYFGVLIPRRPQTRRAVSRALVFLSLFALILREIERMPSAITTFYGRTLNEYVSFGDSPQRRRLEFVHIPKTGGTVIESVAAKGGTPWTICHFLSPLDVATMSMNIIQCPDRNDKKYAKWRKTAPFHGLVWWHLPPSYFFNYANTLPANPYDGADLFAVVRDPYSRLISEYYYQQSWLVNAEEQRKTQNVRYFNEWIKTKLEEYAHFSCQRSAKRDLFRSTNATKSYLSFDGHLISQYDYIYDATVGSTTFPERIVSHVLKFENLTREYDDLMEKYGLKHLTPLPQEHVRKSLPKLLSLFNLTLENLRLIEQVYRQDFLEFGYEMKSTSIPSDILKRNSHLVKCKESVAWHHPSEEVTEPQSDGDDRIHKAHKSQQEDVGFEIIRIFTVD
jgi:CRISPR/Cas system-associated protein endoribonuclease Cas2